MERDHLLLGDLEVAQPDGALPAEPRAEPAHELRDLARGDEMQGSSHRPRLDQRAVLPQGVAHVVPAQAADPRAQRELGRAHDLRLDRHVLPHDVDEAGVRRGREQVLTPHPERGDLAPGDRVHRPTVSPEGDRTWQVSTGVR